MPIAGFNLSPSICKIVPVKKASVSHSSVASALQCLVYLLTCWGWLYYLMYNHTVSPSVHSPSDATAPVDIAPSAPTRCNVSIA